LHPMITGQPLRIKYLQRAIAEMQKNDAVWFATGGEIIHAYQRAHPPRQGGGGGVGPSFLSVFAAQEGGPPSARRFASRPARHGAKIAFNSAASRKPALATWMRACALAQSSYDGSSVVSQVHPPVNEKGEGFEPLRMVRR